MVDVALGIIGILLSFLKFIFTHEICNIIYTPSFDFIVQGEGQTPASMNRG